MKYHGVHVSQGRFGVRNRWAPGLRGWSLPSRVTWSSAFPDTPRTKLVAGAEPCWSKEIRRPRLSLLRSGQAPRLHMRRKPPRGSKREGVPPHNVLSNFPLAFALESFLPRRYALVGRALGQVRCGRRGEVMGQRKTKIREDRPVQTTWPPLYCASSGRTPTPSLSR